MTLPNYRLIYPTDAETRFSYCKRLEDEGHEEMFIRKVLRVHWAMQIEEFGDFFEDFRRARMRHVELVYEMQPTRSAYSFALKMSKNLGIPHSRAAEWVDEFNKNRAAG